MGGNPTIDNIAPDTGRELRDNGTVVNTADLAVADNSNIAALLANAISSLAILTSAADKSGSFRSVDEIQSAVHDGMMFSFTSHGTIAAGASLVLIGVTGNRQVHFDGFNMSISQGPFLIEFFEAPTVTSLGTQQTTHRRNRSNPNVSQMLVYAGGTVSATGTLLADDQLLLVGQGSNVLSGTASVDDGWVLKASTTYLIRLTNQASSTTSYNSKFSWHEATYTV